MKNFYNTLGVAETASEKEIKNAFKALAKKHHPDQGGDENKFKEINEAYDTLKNSEKRQEYDAMRKYGTRGSGLNQQGNDFFGDEIFQEFFRVLDLDQDEVKQEYTEHDRELINQ